MKAAWALFLLSLETQTHLIPNPLEAPKKGLFSWVIGKLGGKEHDMCMLKSVNYEEDIVNNSFSIFSPLFLKVWSELSAFPKDSPESSSRGQGYKDICYVYS